MRVSLRYLTAAILLFGLSPAEGAIEPVGSASRGTPDAASSRRAAAAVEAGEAPAAAAARVQSIAKAQTAAKAQPAKPQVTKTPSANAPRLPQMLIEPSQEAVADAGPVPFPAAGYPWQTNVEEACRLGRQHNLPVLVFVTSASCPYCKMMREQTLRAMPVAREIGGNFIPLRIERGTNPALEKQLAVKSYPTMVVLRGDKSEVARMAGFIQAPQFIGNLKRIEAQWPVLNASRPTNVR